MNNLFKNNKAPYNEIISDILINEKIKVEKIVSQGQKSGPYDSDRDELVFLLSGSAVIKYENGESDILNAGDYTLIPAHKKHRVEYTNVNPPCVWLCIYY